MRDYAKVSPQFWISRLGKQLKQCGVKTQLLALYLLTNPHTHMLGIYYLPITFISHETGIPYDETQATLQQLQTLGFCDYDAESEYVWVHDMAFDQISLQLKSNDNRVRHIQAAYHALPALPFLDAFYTRYHKAFHLVPRISAPDEIANEGKVKVNLPTDEKVAHHPTPTETSLAPEQNLTQAKAEDASPAFITLPLAGTAAFIINQAHITQWQNEYPAIDVPAVMHRLANYCHTKNMKHKTPADAQAFVSHWLKQANRKAHSLNLIRAPNTT